MDPHRDGSKAAVFVLRKMGSPVHLVEIGRSVVIPKDGTPVELSLETGNKVPLGQGDIRVESWTNDTGHPLNSNQPYDWSCRIEVPDGGLQPRTGRSEERR